MIADPKKERETRVLAAACKAAKPLPLPSGKWVPGERPDFRVLAEGGTLGVETAELMPPPRNASSNSPLAEYDMREVVLRTAENLYYRAPGAARVTAQASFWDVERSVKFSKQVSLEFPLDPFRVHGIEGRRHGDLKFRLDLVLVYGMLSRIQQGPQGVMVEVLTNFERSTSQVYLDVPQSHWVGKVLPALGSNRYFLVEVPVQNQHFAAAWALIEKAEQAFGRWDTKAVFAHCREAGVALTNFVGQHQNGDSFLKEERWGRAVKEFNHFASLDLHLEEKKSNGKHSPDLVKIEKMDAECLLIFTKALAKYAEELAQ